MKLTRVRLKSSVTTSNGASSSVLSETDGWHLEASADGVRASRGEEGLWFPNTEVQMGAFAPERVPLGKVAGK